MLNAASAALQRDSRHAGLPRHFGYYQHVYGKRLEGGSIGKLPDSAFEFYRSHPSLLLLAGEAPGRRQERLGADLSEVLRWTQARHIPMHRSLLEADQLRSIERLLDQQPSVQRLGEKDDLIFYCAVVGSCDVRLQRLSGFPSPD